MNDLAFVCDRLEKLFPLDIMFVSDDLKISGGGGHNPICRARGLAAELIAGARAQELPFLYMDEFQVCYGAMRRPGGYVLFGPMSTGPLSGVELHRYCRHYGIEEEQEKALGGFLPAHVLCIAQLLAKEALGRIYSDEELLAANDFAGTKEETEAGQYGKRMQDEEGVHHTYSEERVLLDAVKSGDADAAVALAVKMDMELGRLSGRQYNHWKNAAVAAVTLCARAAIAGGLPPAEAYRLSDFYIQRCDGCRDITQVLECRNRAVAGMARRVRMRQSHGRSGYIERCRDYIENHYREKIRLTELSAALGISGSYLSRLFYRETGVKLQDYIVQVRLEHAASLLRYSDESIAGIAEYVNFPSQSYMGRVFRERMHMSPKRYRECSRTAESVTAGTEQNSVQNKYKKDKK